MVQNMRNNSKEKKEALKRMLEQDRMEGIVVERRKSSNQRELEGYIKENHEKSIKEELDSMRKARRDDISFNHNPIDVKNITSGTEWEVMKEKNQFSGRSNMFRGQGSIHKSNPNLLKSGNVLSHGSNFVHKGSSMFSNKGSGLI